MKINTPLVTVLLLAFSVVPLSIEERVKSLETRVGALERRLEAPSGAEAKRAASSIVSVRLVGKEAVRENPLLDYYNLVFDLEFPGTDYLGSKRIRDIKGAVYFEDAFGETIIGATVTKRLGIGKGENERVSRLSIDYITVESSHGWKRILATKKEELRVRFKVDKERWFGYFSFRKSFECTRLPTDGRTSSAVSA
jgi:hypothetical protein